MPIRRCRSCSANPRSRSPAVAFTPRSIQSRKEPIVDVTMPQLGETVTEGTITRWFKQVGESIAADEPLFEVSTDKVDSEVPAPAAGVVSGVLVPQSDTGPLRAPRAGISPPPAAPPPPAPPPP